MIEYGEHIFHLRTAHYSCLLRVNGYGQLEQLHFGAPVEREDAAALAFAPGLGWGCSILTEDSDTASCLDVLSLAWSGSGRGDYRESPLELGQATDFRFDSYRIIEGNAAMEGILPQPHGALETLEITMTQRGLTLKLYFGLYETAMTRRAVLCNTGDKPVQLQKIMSTMMDLPGEYEMTSFGGAWIGEMRRSLTPVGQSRVVNESTTGFSSNRCNPGFLLSEPGAGEQWGRVYGFNLVYSGNHYASAQRSFQGLTRVMQGISPDNFRRELPSGECFETPEAVLTYSEEGFDGVSQAMHTFVTDHIVPPYWRERERPVLYNDWEGCMFSFTHQKLISLAKEAKAVGCELFVLDDGWFGNRNSDTAGLGDYRVNTKKLPKGLKGLAEDLLRMGLEFGLWMEPESVNQDSDLYRAHPDWALTDDFPPVLGRHQLLLDLTRPEVQDYLVEQITGILDTVPISYVKWDMNRHSTALGSKAHDYILGLYRVMARVFTPRPKLLLENCASGGNRFDLGMLCFGPQIWCSDDTDPVERLTIQENLSYLYPQSTFGAHVSAAPHAQTLRATPLETRGNVSFFGCLGYELDWAHLLPLEKKQIREQITFYKRYRKAFQFGAFHRLAGGWQVSREGTSAVGVFRRLVAAAPGYETLRPVGLKREMRYRYASRKQGLRVGPFGALVKHVSPVNLNPNGMALRIADHRITLLDGSQAGVASGAALMAGLRLLPLFRGTGYDQNQRTLPDFGSELYIIEEETAEALPAPKNILKE